MRNLRVKRGLVLLGIALFAIGIAADLKIVTTLGIVVVAVGFVTAGGA